ncbi:MAG: hypothetical protein Q7R70_06995 [Candidatus Diapherotrites archaeon]|nr:hypothetical protein [Candidatus Diapherotrites archaeon]
MEEKSPAAIQKELENCYRNFKKALKEKNLEAFKGLDVSARYSSIASQDCFNWAAPIIDGQFPGFEEIKFESITDEGQSKEIKYYNFKAKNLSASIRFHYTSGAWDSKPEGWKFEGLYFKEFEVKRDDKGNFKTEMWVGVHCPSDFRLFIDGKLAWQDCYFTTSRSGMEIFSFALPEGSHALKIESSFAKKPLEKKFSTGKEGAFAKIKFIFKKDAPEIGYGPKPEAFEISAEIEDFASLRLLAEKTFASFKKSLKENDFAAFKKLSIFDAGYVTSKKQFDWASKFLDNYLPDLKKAGFEELRVFMSTVAYCFSMNGTKYVLGFEKEKDSLKVGRLTALDSKFENCPSPFGDIGFQLGNESKEASPIDIELKIDGKTAANNYFYNSKKEDWQYYTFQAGKSSHKISVESKQGNAVLEKEIKLEERTLFIIGYANDSFGKKTSGHFSFESKPWPARWCGNDVRN